MGTPTALQATEWRHVSDGASGGSVAAEASAEVSDEERASAYAKATADKSHGVGREARMDGRSTEGNMEQAEKVERQEYTTR